VTISEISLQLLNYEVKISGGREVRGKKGRASLIYL
jgi:hypothetical protein